MGAGPQRRDRPPGVRCGRRPRLARRRSAGRRQGGRPQRARHERRADVVDRSPVRGREPVELRRHARRRHGLLHRNRSDAQDCRVAGDQAPAERQARQAGRGGHRRTSRLLERLEGRPPPRPGAPVCRPQAPIRVDRARSCAATWTGRSSTSRRSSGRSWSRIRTSVSTGMGDSGWPGRTFRASCGTRRGPSGSTPRPSCRAESRRRPRPCASRTSSTSSARRPAVSSCLAPRAHTRRRHGPSPGLQVRARLPGS